MKNFYAVRVGYKTGIFKHIEDAEYEVRGFSGAEWKGFYDYEEAEDYLNGNVKRKTFYVVENLIFNNRQVARDHSDGRYCDEFQTLNAARHFIRSNGDHPVERLREDLCYTNTKGRTVYQVYTDGACSRNGLIGAGAGIGVYFGANNPWNISKRLEGRLQTNQRAELAAIKEAYRKIDDLDDGALYLIYTDSDYARNCLTVWVDDWERYGWTTAKGLPVANQDLIKSILEIKRRRSCDGVLGIEKVAAHSDCEGNNEADRLAVAGIYK